MSSAANTLALDTKKPQRTKTNIRRIEESFTTKDMKITKNNELGCQATAIEVVSRNCCSLRACRSKSRRRDRRAFGQQRDIDRRFALTRRFRQAAGTALTDGMDHATKVETFLARDTARGLVLYCTPAKNVGAFSAS